jgi:hypothetical protein
MRKSEVFPSNWLKAEHLVKDGKSLAKRVTITAIEDTSFKDGEHEKRQRAISFAESDKKLGLNPTNWNTLAVISGQDPEGDPDDDLFVGLKVEVFRTLVQFKDKMVPAVRIRPVGGWDKFQVAAPVAEPEPTPEPEPVTHEDEDPDSDLPF